jgi:hypothetical protein
MRGIYYAVEVDSGVMIPNFIKIGPAIQKLMWRIHRHKDSMVIAQAFFCVLTARKADEKHEIHLLPSEVGNPFLYNSK